MPRGTSGRREAPPPAPGLGLDCRIAGSPHVVGEDSAGERFLLQLDTGSYYQLDRVGTFVWRRLDGRRRLAEVAAEIAAHYRIDERQAAADLLELVRELDAEGLIVRVERADGE